MDGTLAYPAVAAAYAAAATVAIVAIGFAAGRRFPAALLPAVFSILLFLFLTQHPFPSPSLLECPVQGAEANLVPLASLHDIIRTWPVAGGFWSWLSIKGTSSMVMNLVLPMLIGALLERPLGIRRSVLLAFGLSLAAELSQLTGLWGLYPCSYRKFDVDDLLLNTSGGALGAGLAGALRRRRGRA